MHTLTVRYKRWIPVLVVFTGVVSALLIPYGSCVNEVEYEGGPLLYTDCANHIPFRIAIAGIAAVLALALAGTLDPRRRRKLLTGAAALAAGLALALLIPRGGPYYSGSLLHGVGVIVPRYSNRNPLRVAVAATGGSLL